MMRILIADCDIVLANQYADAIRKGNQHEVQICTDGATALMRILTQRPQLALLELNLPRLSGLDLLRTLKEQDHTQETRIFILTDLSQESLIRQAVQQGAENYWIKSAYGPAEVAAEITRLAS